MAGPQALPYHPRPPALQRLLRAVRNHPCVLLSAPRGHGKTSLIENELSPTLLDEGWRVSIIDLQSPVLPMMLLDLRNIASEGDPLAMAALRDHGGIPAHQQVAQALAWIAERSHDPHLLVLENAHVLAEPGYNRLATAMFNALQGNLRQLHVLFTVSSRLAMDELFSRHGAPFQHAAYSVALDSMQEDFLLARTNQLAGLGINVHIADLANCLLRQSYNLASFERVLQCLINGEAVDLADAERHCHKTPETMA